MTNSICRNHQLYKDFLSAHRQAYAQAKQGRKHEIMVSFTPIIVCLAAYQLTKLSPVGAFDLDTLLSAFALSGVAVLLYCDLVLDPIRKKHRRTANLDLEAYDTKVLTLPWNESVAGPIKELSDVKIEAENYQSKLASEHPPELSLVDSWYPEEIEQVPLDIARLYCLRQNCAFELAYREKYIALFLRPMLAFTSILVLTQAWVFGLKLSSVCLTLIVAAPIFRIIILGLLVQTNNLKSMKELKAEIEAAQKLASSKSGSTTTTTTTTKDTEQNTGTSELTARARGFQDRLFISRDTLPLISIGGFKYIKASYLPGLKAETIASLRQDGLLS